MLPAGPIFNVGFHVASGQIAAAAVAYNVGPQQAAFTLVNYSTGAVWAPVQAVPISRYDGNSAEVASELVIGTGPGGYPWQLRKTTNSTSWQNMTFNGGSSFGSVSSLSDTVNLVRFGDLFDSNFFNPTNNVAFHTWYRCA